MIERSRKLDKGLHEEMQENWKSYISTVIKTGSIMEIVSVREVERKGGDCFMKVSLLDYIFRIY